MNPGWSRTYVVAARKHEEALEVLQAAKLINPWGEIGESPSLIRNVVFQNVCCKWAFIRGAFLATDSINTPEKLYHFKTVCPTEPKTEQLKNVIAIFDIEARIVPRKKYYVIYIKEGSQIVDILNVIEVPISPMGPKNIHIAKEIRDSVDRQVSCGTASINRTVPAVVK